MIHRMKLNPEPFAQIASGAKTIELRLNDEKRQLIHVGDRIEFTNRYAPSEKLSVQVIALHPFPTFQELYEVLPLTACGYTEADIADAKELCINN